MSVTVDSQRAEEWRPAPGFPGYEVSSLGRILSRRQGREIVLASWVTPKGYHFVRLSRSLYDVKAEAVHRLVATTFLGPRPEGMEVRHLDGDSSNNRLANLTYGSHSQNVRDTVAHGRHHNAVKTHCPKGHPYTPENTKMEQRGRRCRTCKREHQAAARDRRRTGVPT
jgi:hypothetical protein